MAQNGPKWPKLPKKWPNFENICFIVFLNPQKKPETGTGHFCAPYQSKDNFSSRILNFSNSKFGRKKKRTGEVKIIFFRIFFIDILSKN